MFAIEVEFLMGRAMAAQLNDRTQVEWPPHPQRLFSALVAAHAELELGAAGEDALKWLEALPAPEIKADLAPSIRTSPSYFVPVNDEAAKGVKDLADPRHVLDRRNRQERFFPAAVPIDPLVVFQWPDAHGIDERRATLRSIVEGVTYLGHSASPVRACLRDEPVAPTLCPDADGEYSLRVPGPGRFDRLAETNELRRENESIQPPQGHEQFYGRPIAATPNAFAKDAFVLAFEGGPRLSLDSALPLMQHLRLALLSRLGQAAPESLTGHDASGGMSLDTHLSFVPLAFVNSRHADGSIKGAALVMPREASDSERRRLRASLDDLWQLHLGPLGSISLRLTERADDEIASLRFSSYTRASEYWASITPVVLDRHPKKKGPTAEAIIGAACERAGLPAPVEVRLGPVSAITGAPPAREYHGRSKQVDNRLRQHVV